MKFHVNSHPESWCTDPQPTPKLRYAHSNRESELQRSQIMVAHVWGDPLSRYTCRATHVAADFLRIQGFFRCSSSIALHPSYKAVSHLSPLNGQECRTSSCLWKSVALQRGVAATLAGVALHCATKLQIAFDLKSQSTSGIATNIASRSVEREEASVEKRVDIATEIVVMIRIAAISNR